MNLSWYKEGEKVERKKRRLKIYGENKFCPRCETLKHRDLFHNEKCRGDGKSGVCASCKNTLNKNTRQYKARRLTPEQKKYYAISRAKRMILFWQERVVKLENT